MEPIGPRTGNTDLRVRYQPAVPPTPPPAQPAAPPPAPGHSQVSSFEPAPPAAPAAPVTPTVEARGVAAANVDAARRAYTDARATVNRLNGHLEQALRTNPALRDPAAAERFRTAFMEQHRDAFAREGQTARALADSIRAAQPLLSGIPNPAGPVGMDAPQLRDRMTVARALDTLAQSSEYAQAATLAGQMRQGNDPALPAQVADRIADRAALTGMREDLANGRSVTDALTRASTLLGGAGFVSRIPALSSLGNALAVGENINEFIRTGDPARIGAAGFAALGAGGAAWAAVVGGGPVTMGIAAIAFGGKFICEQVANYNDYRRDTDPAMQRAFGTSRREIETMERQVHEQVLNELAARSPELARAQRMGGGTWMQAMRDHSAWVEQRRAELIAQRMAALQPN